MKIKQQQVTLNVHSIVILFFFTFCRNNQDLEVHLNTHLLLWTYKTWKNIMKINCKINHAIFFYFVIFVIFVVFSSATFTIVRSIIRYRSRRKNYFFFLLVGTFTPKQTLASGRKTRDLPTAVTPHRARVCENDFRRFGAIPTVPFSVTAEFRGTRTRGIRPVNTRRFK